MSEARLSLAGLHRHSVLLTGAPFPELLARLARFFAVDLAGDAHVSDREALRERLAGKSALMDVRAIAIDAPLLAALPHLRAVCRIGASAAGIDLEACTRVPASSSPIRPNSGTMKTRAGGWRSLQRTT